MADVARCRANTMKRFELAKWSVAKINKPDSLPFPNSASSCLSSVLTRRSGSQVRRPPRMGRGPQPDPVESRTGTNTFKPPPHRHYLTLWVSGETGDSKQPIAMSEHGLLVVKAVFY
ncbi:hypothetical protein RRG08_015233 [Elysia crispata]|uniref:Uncharacterized protein n=1 Tax=Elysia crispata TaxID=231223 RepID=A0AAE1A7X9_9GAST|nr:hypothetical protein RRG08_015233 [Elysia crispata]